jgi:hypothetical protein
MAEEPPIPPLYEIPYLRLCPWLRLFRAPAAAGDAKKLTLAALGVILIHFGWESLDRIFPESSRMTPGVMTAWEPIAVEEPSTVFWRIAEPAWLIATPFLAAFDRTVGGWNFLHAVLASLWAIVVWGLIGGAIARVAVVGLIRGERVGVLAALLFARKKVIPLVGSPLMPLLGVAIVCAFVAVFGLIYRIPGPFGPVAAGAIAFLPLLGGLLLTLIVVGLAAGLPLMQASSAVENEDGFDAMSRVYAYVHQRPWHYLAYVGIAAAAGIIGLVFVDLFARLVVHFTAWGLSFGAPGWMVRALYSNGSAIVSPPALAVHSFWLGAIGLLVQSWVYSYFWTAATVIYLLIRRDVDGTPWETIAYDDRPGALLDAAQSARAGSEPESRPSSVVHVPHAAEVRDAGEVIG